jgi:hypothetical protein
MKKIKTKLLDGNKNMDNMRIPANFIWKIIHEKIQICFGHLAIIVWGKLQNDEYLLRDFVQEFDSKYEKKKIIEFLDQENINSDNIKLLSDVSPSSGVWIDVKRLENYYEYDIESLLKKDKRFLIALLGDKGNGKTSLIMYTKKSIEKNSNNIVFLIINNAYTKVKDKIFEEIYSSLIKQVNENILKIADENKMSDDEMTNILYHDDLRIANALVAKTDSEFIKNEKQKRKTEIITKYIRMSDFNNSDCILYLKICIDYIKKFNKNVCLIIDDVDQIMDPETANKIRDDIIEIRDSLDITTIISMREITARKVDDKFGHFYVNHMISPGFKSVIEKRFITFKELMLADTKEAFKRDLKGYNIQDYIKFVETIKNSIINKKELISLFYCLSNNDLQLMLSYFKCVLASSHFSDEEIKSIINGEEISLQKILQILLLYIYEEHNIKNTFLINFYDIGKSYDNLTTNLFKIRIIQIIREFTKKLYEYNYSITYSDLYSKLHLLGYEILLSKHLDVIIEDMIKFHILDIIKSSEDKNNDVIFLYDSASFYIDYLIHTFRYIQTIIPNTYVDYEIDEKKLKGNTKEINEEIEKFIDYIEQCEKEEEKNSINENLWKNLNLGGKISEKMRKIKNLDISRMIDSYQKKDKKSGGKNKS